MSFTRGKVGSDNLPSFLVDYYLAFGGVALLFAGVILALSFFGR